MEFAYMVRGADGKDYGPVSLELLTRWVREGRLTPKQQVRRNDMEHWATATDFSELAPLFISAESVSSAPPPAAAKASPDTPTALAQMKSGASWFYWVAALSLLNSISAFSGSSWRFILGIGVSHFVRSGGVLALAIDLAAAALLVVCGIFAYKGHAWAFILGIVLMALDGVIFLLAQDWLGVAFHAFVLYSLIRGLLACKKLRS